MKRLWILLKNLSQNYFKSKITLMLCQDKDYWMFCFIKFEKRFLSYVKRPKKLINVLLRIKENIFRIEDKHRKY